MIYLDHSATTMVDERVFEAMRPYFGEVYGNPSSLHRQGQMAEAAIEQARQTVANLLACPAKSIFFTACATESNNIVLQGLAAHKREWQIPYHVLTTPVEHPSVLGPLRSIQGRAEGKLSFLPVDRGGKLLSSEIEGLIDDEISLVSVIFGNNEVGTINSIEEIGAFLKDKPTFFHTDAVQCANFIELNVEQLGADFLSLSAHKFYGPKGVGILYARDPSHLQPVMQGGSQENGLRPGTQNVPLIVGAAEALRLAQEICTTESSRLRKLRDAIIDAVTDRIPDCALTGDREQRLPHHASFAFAGIDSNQLLAALDLQGFACSSGSACKVGNPEPSELLLSLGFSEDLARGALRITLGRSSSIEQVEAFIDTLPAVIERLRDKGSQRS